MRPSRTSRSRPWTLGDVAIVLREEPWASIACSSISGVDYEGFDENGKGKHRKIGQYEEDGSVRPGRAAGTGDLGVVYTSRPSSAAHASC